MKLRLFMAGLAAALFVPVASAQRMLTTGYAPGCGDSGGVTASGYHTGPGVVAISRSQFHFGQRFYIAGYGPGVARDTGSAVGWGHIDLWFGSCWQARQWGARYVEVTVL